MSDRYGIICEVGPPAVSCERHMPIAAKALLDIGREPTGEVIETSDPCPICLYEQMHGEEVTIEKLGIPGVENIRLDPRNN